MKRVAVAVFVLLLSVPLAAQMRQDVTIFVPQVDGAGSGPGDVVVFTGMTAMEVAARGYTLAEGRDGSDFTLQGVLAEYGDGYYSLRLSLLDSAAGDVMVEQDMLYQNLEMVNEYFPLLIFNMLANIPLTKLVSVEQPPPEPPEKEFVYIPAEIPPPDDRWRNKMLYAGLTAGWIPRFYAGQGMAAYPVGFGAGLLGEYHFWSHLSAETGVEFAGDRVATPDGDAHVWSLEFPLLLKGVFKPGLHYMLEPYAGVQFNAPLGGVIKFPLAAGALGFQAGTKAGPGAIIVDLRFAMDIGQSSLTETYRVPVPEFQRFFIKLGIGYKYGFIDRKKENP